MNPDPMTGEAAIAHIMQTSDSNYDAHRQMHDVVATLRQDEEAPGGTATIVTKKYSHGVRTWRCSAHSGPRGGIVSQTRLLPCSGRQVNLTAR